MKKVFIIAEAGDNHNGKLDLAFQLIDKAVETGADCVKFQTFKTEEMISRYAEKAEYQKISTGAGESQFDMVKKLELSFDNFRQLEAHCRKKRILFLSTPFDIPSIDFLEEFMMPFWKIPSGEITNLPYLIRIAQTKKDVVLSTGMSNMDEITEAVRILRRNGTPNICLLHCNTEYPTPMQDVNLNALQTLQTAFGLKVGYSDHTLGIEVPIAATALGASIIEKHFTLDCTMEGPDHKASLEPDMFAEMVRAIRNIEQAMGNGIKQASPSEEKNKSVARKSIVAACPIKKGAVFSEKNLASKRPGNGISPMKWFDIIGQSAVRDFQKDELIEL